MKISIGLLGLDAWFGGDLKGVLELIRIADAKGVDQLSVTDHVIMGEDVDAYPYGRFPMPRDFPWHEPLTILSAIAAVTETIRLSTGILISPLRPAVLLAKQLATLDVLSQGRLTIGLGVGWQKAEYDACGIPWEGRFGLMEEQVRVCRGLWSSAPASFQGKHVAFDRLYSLPFPVQQGGIPIWFGLAPTDRNFERIAALGDGWIPMERDPGKLAESVGRLKAAFVAHGRDPAALSVRMGVTPVAGVSGKADIHATLKQLPALAAAGASVVEFHPTAYCRGPDDFEDFLDAILSLKGSEAAGNSS